MAAYAIAATAQTHIESCRAVPEGQRLVDNVAQARSVLLLLAKRPYCRDASQGFREGREEGRGGGSRNSVHVAIDEKVGAEDGRVDEGEDERRAERGREDNGNHDESCDEERHLYGELGLRRKPSAPLLGRKDRALPDHGDRQTIVDDTNVLGEAVDDCAERDEVEPSKRGVDDSREELVKKRARGEKGGERDEDGGEDDQDRGAGTDKAVQQKVVILVDRAVLLSRRFAPFCRILTGQLVWLPMPILMTYGAARTARGT